MPDLEIASVDDPRIDVYRDLKQPSGATRRTFVAEGEKLVLRLLESSLQVESILCTPAMRERLGERIQEEIPVYVASTPLISKLIGFQFHRGVLACGLRPVPETLAALLASPAGSDRSLLVLCPEIRDPENLGTIIRTAAAFGAAGVIAGESGTDPFSRRVLRTSMGTVLRLPVIQTDSWAETVRNLNEAGFETIAAILDSSAEPLAKFKPTHRAALLLGNEDAGLAADLISICRRRVTMPMAPGTDSLNVAVAAGILMHHLVTARELH